MPKRNAATELNDRNWDQEDDAEEAGEFQLAEEDVLKTRIIRKAKRTTQSENSGKGGGVFSGFALQFIGSSSSVTPAKNFDSSQVTTQANGSASGLNGGENKDNPDYLRQLKVLNENLVSWIEKHVNENPYCILTPSLKDYEKHLSDLEKKYSVKIPVTGDEGNGDSKAGESMKSTFKRDVPATNTPIFSFGLTPSQASVPAAKLETSQVSENKAFPTFSFTHSVNGPKQLSQGSTLGSANLKSFAFSFGSSQQQESQSAGKLQSVEVSTGDGDDDYVPPKPEVREIKEEGAVFTKRCKLFYQKDGQWVDRGVGNLHLKPTDGDHTQLVIRADTNLGNILLNILLSPAIPIKKQGKNNVFIVCIPNPPISSKDANVEPVPMLIRVKTSEDADELLAELEKRKGSN